MTNFSINSIFLIFICIICFNNIQSQCYFLQYKDTPALPERAIEQLKIKDLERPFSTYTLQTDGNYSLYKYLDSYPNGATFNIFDNYYFKNYQLNEVQIVDFAGQNPIGTKIPLIDAKFWKIYPDTFLISGFKCLKASLEDSKEKAIAYFTNEVPINEGPQKYNNLPGLIVQLEIVSSTIELILIKKLNTCSVSLPENFCINYISKNEWDRYLKSNIDAFIGK